MVSKIVPIQDDRGFNFFSVVLHFTCRNKLSVMKCSYTDPTSFMQEFLFSDLTAQVKALVSPILNLPTRLIPKNPVNSSTYEPIMSFFYKKFAQKLEDALFAVGID